MTTRTQHTEGSLASRTDSRLREVLANYMDNALASGGDASYEAAVTFIVRACNAHADLASALKTSLPQLEWANIHGSRCEELLQQAKAALAKASA